MTSMVPTTPMTPPITTVLAAETALTSQALVIAALAVVTAGALAVIAVQARREPYRARIGLRYAARRRLHSGLVIAGLMLATTFISTAFTLDDAVTRAIEGVAVFSLGRVDEEVVGGGYGPLGLYTDQDAAVVGKALRGDARVAGVAPALVLSNLLLVDQTSRQIRGDVLGVAIDPTAAGPLAQMSVVTTGVPAPIASLSPTEVYLNQQTATLLGARVGDTIYAYSTLWPGRRYEATVLAIVEGGPLAQRPSAMFTLSALQDTLALPGLVNRVYIANAGDGLSGVAFSDDIAGKAVAALPKGFRVRTVKQDGIEFALQGQQVFGRILALYTLFALSIGLLLIFLIFSLLASERRSELGTERAVGMQRSDVVWTLLFEGITYDLAAAAPGVLAGLALGAGVIVAITPTVSRLGLPLRVEINPGNLVLSFCLGVIFTLAAIVVAVGTVTRFTIAAALRNLPEPPPPSPSLREVAGRVLAAVRRRSRPRVLLGALTELARALAEDGAIPLAVGLLLIGGAVRQQDGLQIAIAIGLVALGALLMMRAVVLGMLRRLVARRDLGRFLRVTERVDRTCALVVGVAVVAYWALPGEILRAVGVPRFEDSSGVVFAASVSTVVAAVLALGPNLDIAVSPLQWLARRARRARRAAYVALIYPAQQRLRTGISLLMFSLVCFTMVVMACIAASANEHYANLDVQSGGYDVIGQPLFQAIGGVDEVRALVQSSAPGVAADVAAVGGATPLPLLMLQPSAKESRWAVYPAAAIDGALLDGEGLSLVARAKGYASDADVWRALRDEPGTAVVDVGALSAQDIATLGVDAPAPVSIEQFVAPPIASGLLGFSALESLLGRTGTLQAQDRVPPDVRAILSDPRRLHNYTLQLRGLAQGHGVIAGTSIWVADPRANGPTEIRIIGVVDNSSGQRYGLLASRQTFAPVTQSVSSFAGEFYLFRLRQGADVNSDARAIGAALLDYGFETTPIRQALLDVNGPAVFASRVLIGLVAMTLLVGMAALAVTGTRAVVERRQQIGMLRALGYRRGDVSRMFVVEAAFVGGLGALLGLGLGLLVCGNVLTVGFFQQFETGIALVVPWPALVLICAVAVGTALVAAVLPAAQASRVAPAEALRYE